MSVFSASRAYFVSSELLCECRASSAPLFPAAKSCFLSRWLVICVRVNWNTWASGVSRALINWETVSRNPALLPPSSSSCADRVVQRGCSNRLKRLTTCVYIQRWKDPLYILPLAHTDLLLWVRVSHIIRVLYFRASKGKHFYDSLNTKPFFFKFFYCLCHHVRAIKTAHCPLREKNDSIYHF